MFPLETLPPPTPGDPSSGVVYLRIVLSPEQASRNQPAMRMHHIAICGLPHSTTSSHVISLTSRFKKKTVTEHKMCIMIFDVTFIT